MRDSQSGETTGRRLSFRLLELLAVVVIVLLLLGLTLPWVGTSRESARRFHCTNNLKNILLATFNYEATHNSLPTAMGGTAGDPLQSNASRRSGMVAMLPELDHTALYDYIRITQKVGGVTYPPQGPAPWIADYPAWTTQPEVLECPSAAEASGPFGKTNYAFCIGDLARDIHQPTMTRGAFACGQYLRTAMIRDGASNTIFFAEIDSAAGKRISGQMAIQQSSRLLEKPSLCFDLRDAWNHQYYAGQAPLRQLGRGGRWADGSAGDSLFNTILPPNSPSAAIDGDEAADGLYSAGSQHRRGVNVGMGDGSVRLITHEIDCGDLSLPTPTMAEISRGKVASPYGVWGALGTASGGEPSINDF